MMTKYRKKPVVVEAIKLEHNKESVIDAVKFVFNEDMETGYANAMYDIVSTNGGLIISTLEGEMKADFGDYIIKGIIGEFYPCKSEVFEATYEKVE